MDVGILCATVTGLSFSECRENITSKPDIFLTLQAF